MGKLTISMAIFNSYFDITRGYQVTIPGWCPRMPKDAHPRHRVASDRHAADLRLNAARRIRRKVNTWHAIPLGNGDKKRSGEMGKKKVGKMLGL